MTRVAYCCQKVGNGKHRRWCENPPEQDIQIGHAWLGSFCVIHARLVLEAMEAKATL